MGVLWDTGFPSGTHVPSLPAPSLLLGVLAFVSVFNTFINCQEVLSQKKYEASRRGTWGPWFPRELSQDSFQPKFSVSSHGQEFRAACSVHPQKTAGIKVGPGRWQALLPFESCGPSGNGRHTNNSWQSWTRPLCTELQENTK